MTDIGKAITADIDGSHIHAWQVVNVSRQFVSVAAVCAATVADNGEQDLGGADRE